MTNFFNPFTETQKKTLKSLTYKKDDGTLKSKKYPSFTESDKKQITKKARILYKKNNKWIEEEENVSKKQFEKLSFKEKLVQIYLLPYFKFTPENDFKHRRDEILTQTFTHKIPKNILYQISSLNFDKNIVFHYPESKITYIPIFHKNILKKKLYSFKDIKAILVIDHKNDLVSILLRDEKGQVREIGATRFNKQNVENIAEKLNTPGLNFVSSITTENPIEEL